MQNDKIKIVPATKAHAKEFYGESYAKSFKGYVAILNGKVVGFGGISFEGNHRKLFTDMKEEMRPFKKDIVRAVSFLKTVLETVSYPVYAIADCNEVLSEKLLAKLGFTESIQTTPDGKVFWRIP